jgi:hypothetical protein
MPARVLLLLVLLVVAGCGREEAPPPLVESEGGAAAQLLDDLRTGGHVLVVRHTTTESTTDRQEQVGDCGSQRNLNAQGRREAQELGAALRALEVPVGVVRMSPLCRTRETAELAFGASAQEDVVLVTHTGNIGDAFGLSVLEGEAVVFRPPPGGPDAGEPPEPVGQIGLEDWRALAGEAA